MKPPYRGRSRRHYVAPTGWLPTPDRVKASPTTRKLRPKACEKPARKPKNGVRGSLGRSHRIGAVRQWYDGPRRRDVTGGRARTSGPAVRGQPDPPAGGGLPDARLGERGRRRRAGVVASAEPLRNR